MKAISLHQPWASLVGRGKSIETRSWPTSYRGPIAIHAAKKWSECQRVSWHAFAATANQRVATVLPFGAIVATASLVDCIPTERVTDRPFKDNKPWYWSGEFLYAGQDELTFGDYSPGRYAWLLEDIRILPEPVPCRGNRRIFNIPDELLEGSK